MNATIRHQTPYGRLGANTPKPHEDMKLGKPTAKKAKSPAKRPGTARTKIK